MDALALTLLLFLYVSLRLQRLRNGYVKREGEGASTCKTGLERAPRLAPFPLATRLPIDRPTRFSLEHVGAIASALLMAPLSPVGPAIPRTPTLPCSALPRSLYLLLHL